MIEEKVKERLGDKIVNWEKKNDRRYYIEIKKEDLVECAKILFNEFNFRFSIASGVDCISHFEVLYHFSADKYDRFFTLRVKLDMDRPEVNSLSGIISATKWIEREICELLGINFVGNPEIDMHLLLPADWPKGVYPLRKTYKGERPKL